MTTTLELPDTIANAIKEVPEEHLAKHIIGKSGFTVAKEDEILAITDEDLSDPMTPDEFLAEMQEMIDTDGKNPTQ